MVFAEELILRTKLQSPRLRRWTLVRSRLINRLEEAADYRLTLLVAPTGYGKSTLLSGWLASRPHPHAWYSLGQLDLDPSIFLLHLIYAFKSNPCFAEVGSKALEVLEREWGEAGNIAERRSAFRPALHLFINELCSLLKEDTFLVLDDFHLLEEQREVVAVTEELIAAAPPLLHIILSSRQTPDFEHLSRWQVRQEVLSIDKEALAFTPEETSRLFEECYGYTLTGEMAARLSAETEGWIIALQMIWQNLQTSNNLALDAMLKDLPRNLTGLFDYLAHEVLSKQEKIVQDFLLDSSVLRRMTGESCDFVLELPAGQSESMLRHLSEAGLFLTVQGDDTLRSYRYHHLFGKFLYARLQGYPERAANLHQRAATYHSQKNQPEDSLHHLLAAGDWAEAADLLEAELGKSLIEGGRLERLEHWLSTFPAGYLAQRPALLLLQGDYLRLTSRFEPALQSYRQAVNGYETAGDKVGLARALRGRAMVYLDTVQPAAAEELLERALETVESTGDRQLWSMLLRDLAENKLNRGRPLEAEELHAKARELLGEANEANISDARILLRSGRIPEAIEMLERTTGEDLIAGEGGGRHIIRRAGRSHREGLLVLSLLNSIRGEGEKAWVQAEQGIFLARELRTPFTEAVAWERLGHALTVSGQLEKAHEAFEKGLALGDKLQVRRLRAEGFMGECLLFGRIPGKLVAARRAGEEGLQIARSAGDEWIEGFIQLSLAAALTENGEHAEAIGAAQAARALLENCGDRFGLALSQLWMALANGDPDELKAARRECEQKGFRFLFDGPTLFGPKSPEMFKKLEESSKKTRETEHGRKASTPVTRYPLLETPVLQVSTLGIFAVRRPDGSELGPRDWQREKARQLFQLLLTRREKPLPKEQILDYLWPESDSSSADSSFKVALNALVRALEPERSSRTQSSYIVRSGSGASLAYALNIEPGQVWLDAVEFEKLANQGARAELAQGPQNEAAALDYYSRALELYRGDFLPGCLYEDWAAPERERLLTLFLSTAERLTRLLAAREEWHRCLSVCHLILARDNCWEEAYRLMMLALWKQGNRAAALRAYEKCAAALSEELGVEPMPQTIKLYNEILLD